MNGLTFTSIDDMLECGHVAPRASAYTCGTGYGLDTQDNRSCYACCARQDIADMREHGAITLYLTGDRSRVTNWPGSLSFPVLDVVKHAHGGGFGAQRTDCDFIGPDGMLWHGVNRGDMDILRCKRVKNQPEWTGPRVPRFRDLAIGQAFDFVSGTQLDSFTLRCFKCSPRRYRDEKGYVHRIGTINCYVYNLGAIPS